jgi:ribonuclease VapC
MVIDSSALVAIQLQEPEADRFMQTAAATPLCLVSAASYLETCMAMIGRSGPLARVQLDRLVHAIDAGIHR